MATSGDTRLSGHRCVETQRGGRPGAAPVSSCGWLTGRTLVRGSEFFSSSGVPDPAPAFANHVTAGRLPSDSRLHGDKGPGHALVKAPGQHTHVFCVTAPGRTPLGTLLTIDQLDSSERGRHAGHHTSFLLQGPRPAAPQSTSPLRKERRRRTGRVRGCVNRPLNTPVRRQAPVLRKGFPADVKRRVPIRSHGRRPRPPLSEDATLFRQRRRNRSGLCGCGKSGEFRKVRPRSVHAQDRTVALPCLLLSRWAPAGGARRFQKSL